MKRSWLVASAATLLAAGVTRAADYLAYVGAYTSGESKGIYLYRFHPATGRMDSLGIAAETSNPSFLAIHPNGRFLYAANEDAAGAVSAFAIDPATGKLRLLSHVSSRGDSPCHLALDATGRWLAVANYTSGTIAVLPIHADGALGEAAAFVQHTGKGPSPRQTSPHAHCVLFSPDNRFLLVADLGLDHVMVYHFDAAKGSISPNDPPYASVPPGHGARHLAFHPNGKYLYVLNEIVSSVTRFRYDAAAGALDEAVTIAALPENFKGANTAAELVLNRAGTRLYSSNRGEDGITLFGIDPPHFTLSSMGQVPALVKTPRFITLDPTGRYLLAAGQDSDDIVTFLVNPHTGELAPAKLMPVKVSKPVCLVFLPAR